jgi:hypothetical protein
MLFKWKDIDGDKIINGLYREVENVISEVTKKDFVFDPIWIFIMQRIPPTAYFNRE